MRKLILGLMMGISLLQMGCPGLRGGKTGLQVSRFMPYSWSYAGIRVLLRETPREPISLVLVYPPAQNAHMRALDRLALRTLLASGTPSLSGVDFMDSLSERSIYLQAQVFNDRTCLRLAASSEELGGAMALLALAMKRPHFDPVIFEAERELLGDEVRYMEELQGFSPGALVDEMRGQVPAWLPPVYPGEESIRALTLSQVQAHFKKRFQVRMGLTLVVAGSIDAEVVSDLLYRGLGGLPEGLGAPVSFLPAATQGQVFFHHQEEKEESMALRLVYAPDVSPAVIRVMTAFFHQRLEELFSNDPVGRKGLLLPPGNLAQGESWVYLKGFRVLPRAEMIASRIRKMRVEPVTEVALTAAKEVSLSSVLRTWQSNLHCAEDWSRWALRGTASQLEAELMGVQGVRPKDLIRLLEKQLLGMDWYFVGDSSHLDQLNLTRLN